jgi:AMMECR1 domain-containing protein
MHVHVSVLSPTVELGVTTLDELKAALEPGLDGVVIESGRHRATFLPAVWEQIPDVDEFLDHLWTKAGLRRRTWPRNLQVWRYRVNDFEADGPRPPIT